MLLPTTAVALASSSLSLTASMQKKKKKKKKKNSKCSYVEATREVASEATAFQKPQNGCRQREFQMWPIRLATIIVKDASLFWVSWWCWPQLKSPAAVVEGKNMCNYRYRTGGCERRSYSSRRLAHVMRYMVICTGILRKYWSSIYMLAPCTQSGPNLESPKPSAETSWLHGRNGREVLRGAVAALVGDVIGSDADRCFVSWCSRLSTKLHVLGLLHVPELLSEDTSTCWADAAGKLNIDVIPRRDLTAKSVRRNTTHGPQPQAFETLGSRSHVTSSYAGTGLLTSSPGGSAKRFQRPNHPRIPPPGGGGGGESFQSAR